MRDFTNLQHLQSDGPEPNCVVHRGPPCVKAYPPPATPCGEDRLRYPMLRDGGDCVMKVFEGEAYPELLERCRRAFDAVKGFKPKASRSISREMFVVALGYRGAPAEEPPAGALPPRRAPSRGWSTGAS